MHFVELQNSWQLVSGLRTGSIFFVLVIDIYNFGNYILLF